MNLQREATGSSGTAMGPGDPPLVVVLGEQIDTGLVVLEAFLEEMARAKRRLLVLLAKRRKFLAASDDGQALEDYEYLKRKAKALGVGMEARLTVAREPYADIRRQALEIAGEYPEALFCFVEWGIEEGKPNLRRELDAENLRTTNLLELLKALRERLGK